MAGAHHAPLDATKATQNLKEGGCCNIDGMGCSKVDLMANAHHVTIWHHSMSPSPLPSSATPNPNAGWEEG